MPTLHSPAPPRAGTEPPWPDDGAARCDVHVQAEVVVAQRPSGLDAVVVKAARCHNARLQAEVVLAERRPPFELWLVEPFLSEIAWLRDLARHLHWLERDSCHRAADAARVLVDPQASPVEQAEAREVLREFMLEDLRFNDAAVRRRFNHRELARLDPFAMWGALIAELLSERWRKCASDWPLFYLRYALVLAADRYYKDAVKDLRQRDAEHVELEVLDRQPLPAWERKGEPNGQDQKHLAQPSHPIHKPGAAPRVIQELIMKCDLATVLGRVKGLPQDVGALIEHRVRDGGPDADLVESSGWSEAQLEKAQTSWRDTWRATMQELFADSGYAPTPPELAWRKWRKWRKFNFENPRQNGPTTPLTQ